MNKEQTIKRKKEQNRKRANQKNMIDIESLTHELGDVKFDITELQVLSVDGVLVDINIEEGRLLFYTTGPSIKVKDNKEEDQSSINKCRVELRMPTSTLVDIVHTIAEDLLFFMLETKKKISNDSIKEEPPQMMFV